MLYSYENKMHNSFLPITAINAPVSPSQAGGPRPGVKPLSTKDDTAQTPASQPLVKVNSGFFFSFNLTRCHNHPPCSKWATINFLLQISAGAKIKMLHFLEQQGP